MYKTYIALVWRDIARGNTRMSREVLQALEAFLTNLFDVVATEAATRLAKYRTKRTLGAAIIGRAVRGVLKRTLAQAANAAIQRSTGQSVDGLSYSRMHTYLKRGGYADRVSPEAGAAMAATLDVILGKVLRAAHPFVHQSGLKTLRMAHVLDGLHADPHLRDLRLMFSVVPPKPQTRKKKRRKPAAAAARKKKSTTRRKRRVSFTPDAAFRMYHPDMPPTDFLPGYAEDPEDPGKGGGGSSASWDWSRPSSYTYTSPSPSPRPSPSATPRVSAIDSDSARDSANPSANVVQVDSVDTLQMLLDANAFKLGSYIVDNFTRAQFLRSFHPDRCIAGAAAITKLFRGIDMDVNLTLGGPVACQQLFNKFYELFEK